MTIKDYDAVCVGAAIVDVLAEANDGFLDERGLAKGAMRLIDEDEAEALYGAMGPGIEISGGSAANTAAGLAALGGDAAFIGRVRDDELGEVFSHDIRAQGVTFTTAASGQGPLTARCLVLITPDAQRTMNTFLGASATLHERDVDDELVAAAKVTYLEGYLWDAPQGPAIFRRAADIAKQSGREVAMTLSDPFCVDRHREAFSEFITSSVDILFANEVEVKSLYQAKTFDEAADRAAQDVRVAALTRSEKGSVICRGGDRHQVSARPVKVVDTTGAGDLYAAGFLYGYTHGASLERAGHMGSICAAEVISHIGARPRAKLKALIAEQLG